MVVYSPLLPYISVLFSTYIHFFTRRIQHSLHFLYISCILAFLHFIFLIFSSHSFSCVLAFLRCSIAPHGAPALCPIFRYKRPRISPWWYYFHTFSSGIPCTSLFPSITTASKSIPHSVPPWWYYFPHSRILALYYPPASSMHFSVYPIYSYAFLRRVSSTSAQERAAAGGIHHPVGPALD